MNKPYSDEQISETTHIRIFDSEDSSEYVWHRDKTDRRVTVLEGAGWQFQYDEEVPFLINSNDTFFIPKYVFHRLIRGNDRLKIKIEEVI